jgi:hypothetical protein
MSFISGAPSVLTVKNAADFVQFVDDEIAKLTVLRDELRDYQKAKLILADAQAAKQEADEYAAKVKADIDGLKTSTSEKLAKAKKREAEADCSADALAVERANIQAEKDAALQEVAALKAELDKERDALTLAQGELLSQQMKYEQERADLDARVAKFQATAAALSQ